MGWRADREQRRAARERERIRREFEDLDHRHGLAGPVGRIDDEPIRRRGCLPRLLTLVLTAAVAFGGLQLVGSGLTEDGARSLVDRLTSAAGSWTNDLGPGWVYVDGGDGQVDSGGQGYSFIALQNDGTSPVTWPCSGTVPIEVNPQGAPSGYQAVLSAAIERVNAASGFTFEIVGETSDRDFLERRSGPILLGFADEEELEMLSGRTAGLGGAVYARPVSGPAVAVGGVVALDTDVFTEDLPAGFGAAIVVHELAHVLGLGHTAQSGELMRSTGSAQSELGSGDLAGLAHLREHACS